MLAAHGVNETEKTAAKLLQVRHHRRKLWAALHRLVQPPVCGTPGYRGKDRGGNRRERRNRVRALKISTGSIDKCLVQFHPVATPAPRPETTMPEPFPTMGRVERADRAQIARWFCFLPAPQTANQQNIMDRIADRYMNMGGMTPGLSKEIGLTEAPGSSRTAPNDAHSIATLRDSGHPGPQRAVELSASLRTLYKATRLLKAT